MTSPSTTPRHPSPTSPCSPPSPPPPSKAAPPSQPTPCRPSPASATPASAADPRSPAHCAPDLEGFSLHAKVLIPAGEPERLEHLCRDPLRNDVKTSLRFVASRRTGAYLSPAPQSPPAACRSPRAAASPTACAATGATALRPSRSIHSLSSNASPPSFPARAPTSSPIPGVLAPSAGVPFATAHRAVAMRERSSRTGAYRRDLVVPAHPTTPPGCAASTPPGQPTPRTRSTWAELLGARLRYRRSHLSSTSGGQRKLIAGSPSQGRKGVLAIRRCATNRGLPHPARSHPQDPHPPRPPHRAPTTLSGALDTRARVRLALRPHPIAPAPQPRESGRAMPAASPDHLRERRDAPQLQRGTPWNHAGAENPNRKAPSAEPGASLGGGEACLEFLSSAESWLVASQSQLPQ